ncbi:MltA domain-containing protein [Thalassotalea sp. PLHSN55]|uniref:MltA domain-containing protein n=1 Tax=Thalassotalea sp. PLHSN55 TaxID=3435888 RepID=UPI003F82AA20
MRKWPVIVLFFISFPSMALQFVVEENPNIGLPKGFKGSELCQVAENTRTYLVSNKADKFAVHAGSNIHSHFSLPRIMKTLDFLCQTYREDVRAKRASRLHDADFLQQHFEFIRWYPDTKTANDIADKSTNEVKSRLLRNIPNDSIFLTKYYTKKLNASAVKTQHFDQALYSLPYDEQQLPLAQAEQVKETLTRYQYTRQDVINGVLLEKNLAKPLVWLTEEALHDVLLQGTGVLNVNGETRYFNVHRNNGIAYNYSIGKREQARYWYFAEVPSIMGYGETLASKIAIKPQVTFAGNVAQLGLGKLVMVSYQNQGEKISRLGILADQGGAFDNNLFQLDLLVDSYFGWQDYHQANKHLPDYADAWFMLIKE